MTDEPTDEVYEGLCPYCEGPDHIRAEGDQYECKTCHNLFLSGLTTEENNEAWENTHPDSAVDMDQSVTRQEVMYVIQSFKEDMQGLADQFSSVINQVLVNQKALDARITELESPTKPKIYLP